MFSPQLTLVQQANEDVELTLIKMQFIMCFIRNTRWSAAQ